jgi:hypothetical protein
MNNIISKYPDIQKMYNIPLNKRNGFLNISNLEQKKGFVNEANDYNKGNYEEFLKGKKVAIIGPSPSIRNEENGDFIEKNYDIIVRINKQWKHDSNLDSFIGKRTDVLYNCIDYSEECGGMIDINYVNKCNLKYIVDPIKFDYNNKSTRDNLFHGEYRLNNYVIFHLNNMGVIPFHTIKREYYEEWDRKTQTRINTGMLAILHILKHDIKELYIKGFSFFKDGYLGDYRSKIANININEKNSASVVSNFMKHHGNHDQKKQWLYFKELLQDENTAKKVKMDQTLEKIMNLDEFD